MVKTIIKIFYITVCVILSVIFGIMNYNSSSDEAYIDIVTQASKEEDTEKLVYAFSSFSLPYNATPNVTYSNGDNDKLYIYETFNQVNANYYKDKDSKDATETFSRVEFIYYIFVRNPKFGIANVPQNGVMSNKTAIRFYNEDNKYFDYYLVVSDNINKEEYNNHPMSVKEAAINNKRTYTTTYMNNRFDYHFLLIPLSETLASCIKERLDNKDITKINYVDSKGELVYANDIDANLNYSQEFFTDLTPYRDAFRNYYDAKDTEEGKKVKEDAKTYINNFKLSSFNKANYKEGLKKDEIYNAGLVWKTIGFVVLFVLSFSIIYMLFFHFALIKRLVFRRSNQKSNQRYVPNKIDKKNMYQPKNKTNTIDAEVKEIKNDNDSKESDNKPTDNVEENKEAKDSE